MATTAIDKKYRVRTRRELEQVKWDSAPDMFIDRLLDETNDALTHIHAARLDARLKIAAKEKEIMQQWTTAKLQQMRYLKHDLDMLHKESKLFDRLLKKAEAARLFIIAKQDERVPVA